MKKLLSVLLALVLFAQALPLNAAAEALNPPPTSQELSAAVAVTGLADDAPPYRSGMAISKSMSAIQMVGWIREFHDQKLISILDIFENYDVELGYLKENYPVTFDMLKGFSGAGIGLLYDEYSSAKDWQDEVNYYRDLLSSTASQIQVLADLLQKGDITEREQVVYAYQIRDKWRTLSGQMRDVLTLAGQWEEQYEHYRTLLSEEYAYSGSTESLGWLLERVDNLREMDGRASVRTFSVSASAVRVQPDNTLTTRLARLSPIGSALADSDQQMSVTVLDDKSFFIGALEDTAPLSGVSINVSAESVSGEKKTTDGSGYISMPIRNYPTNDKGETKVNLTVSREGYRTVDAPGVWVMKGGVMKVPMIQDNGDPYPVSWTFWNNDLLLSDYELVLSPFNDSKQDIRVRISSKAPYTIKMYFTDKNGKNRLNVGDGSGEAGEKDFIFSGMWLKKAAGDGKLFLEVTPNGGSTVTYQAKIKLIAAKVENPVGDPNFKMLMEPGISFPLPKSWPKPFSDMTVHINTPLDSKFKIRFFIDLAGNFTVTLGTNAFEDSVKAFNEGLWKSQDRKAMDDAVNKVEKQGRMAKAKAENGGDWDGRSKWSPLKLGSIKVDMAWYGFVQGQYRETDDGNKELRGKGGAGFILTVTGEAGLQWPLVNLSLVPKAIATIFPEVGIMLDLYWPSDEAAPTVKSSKYVIGSLNFILRIELGLTLCIGLKGVLNVAITGIGFLEFQVRLSLGGFADMEHWDPSNTDANGKFTLYGGAMFRVELEVLWVKTYYTPFGPMWRWRLLPTPIEKAEGRPDTLTDRFIASLISSAKAEEEDDTPVGGMQVDTGNDDLILESEEVRRLTSESTRTSLFKMRPSGGTSSDPVPMLFSLRANNDGSTLHFKRPVLICDNIEGVFRRESPIPKVGPEKETDTRYRYTDGGYDVIDFDYWVQDVSGANVSTYYNGNEKKLTDVLFVVTIMAKEYEEQKRILSDGTEETRNIPIQTWAYVHCYSLSQNGPLYELAPVVLTPGGDHLADLYETKYLDKYQNPCGNPRIYGNIVRTADSIMTFYRVTLAPLNIDTTGNRSNHCMQILSGVREDGKVYKSVELMQNTDVFFENRMYDEFCFYNIRDNSKIYDIPPNRMFIGSSSVYYTLVRGANTAEGLYNLSYDNGFNGTAILENNVLSIVPRKASEDMPQMIFFVQQTEDGEGYSLKGLNPNIHNRDKEWTVWDYGVSIPAVNIQWTTLYGRECVYWIETSVEEEDGSGSLYKVRGMWYDGNSNTMSEPFTLGTIKTPTGCSPKEIILNGFNSGYYVLDRIDDRPTVHRFSFQMVVGAKLVGNMLTETLVTPGTYDDMLLTLYNNGNVPLAGMDLTAYEQKDDGSSVAFETIHLDVLNPANNRVTINRDLDDAVETKQGVTVARQEDCSLNNLDTQYWLVKNKTCLMRPERILSEGSSLQRTKLIMPGTFAAFNISLLMPRLWSNSHDIYLQVERLYTTSDSSFANDANAPSLLQSASPQLISVGRDGSVQQEGGLLGRGTDDTDYAAMFKTDVTFESISLNRDFKDLNILARRWDASSGTPMVSLTVNNRAYTEAENGTRNTVTLEAFLDDETTPVFRYVLPEEVSDKSTWTFDLPLALLTDGRSAEKVTVKVNGKNYTENGEYDNKAIIYLDADNIKFLTQAEDVTVPAGGTALFRAAVSGGRAPLSYQWQVQSSPGEWVNIEDAVSDTLTLNAVGIEMDGYQYRLCVTDASGYTAQSRAAALHVKKVPHTGDTAPVMWYILGIAVSLAVIAFILLRKKRTLTDKR